MWERFVELAVIQEFRPLRGAPGTIVGITGGAVTIAQVADHFDSSAFFALMLGSAAAFGGLGWQIYCSGLNALLKECMRLRQEIARIDDEHHAEVKLAESERIELYRRNASLEGQLARIRSQMDTAEYERLKTGEYDLPKDPK